MHAAINALAADVAAGGVIVTACVLASRLGPSRRTRAALRAAYRCERSGALVSIAIAGMLVLAATPTAASFASSSMLGAAAGPALIGLLALLAGGRLERHGRPAAARRLARRAVPWIVVGSLACLTASVALGPLSTPGAIMLLGSAVVGALGGLARKPRPAAAIGLLLHGAGVGLAAAAWPA